MRQKQRWKKHATGQKVWLLGVGVARISLHWQVNIPTILDQPDVGETLALFSQAL
jgi:hypothetical protein